MPFADLTEESEDHNSFGEDSQDQKNASPLIKDNNKVRKSNPISL
jgi:hypothetical protein